MMSTSQTKYILGKILVSDSVKGYLSIDSILEQLRTSSATPEHKHPI